MPETSTVAAVSRRDRFLIASCLLVITGLAWWYLFTVKAQMSTMSMPGMLDVTAPARASDVFFTFAMWAVMMVGMMSASAAPVLFLFAGLQSRQKERAALIVLIFGLGYIAVWFGFSAVAAAVQTVLRQYAILSPAMAVVSPRLAGSVLLLAGGYQLTNAKQVCLTHCQSPLGFLMNNWRDGKWGAFQMGLHHGKYCLGCCWAVMLLLFALGVMNLAWVAALGVFILIEKIAPAGGRVARASGLLLLSAGLLLLLR